MRAGLLGESMIEIDTREESEIIFGISAELLSKPGAEEVKWSWGSCQQGRG